MLIPRAHKYIFNLKSIKFVTNSVTFYPKNLVELIKRMVYKVQFQKLQLARN